MNRPGAEEVFTEEPWLTTNICQGFMDAYQGDKAQIGPTRVRADSFETFISDKQIKDTDKDNYHDIKVQREKVRHMEDNLQQRFYPFQPFESDTKEQKPIVDVSQRP